MGWSLRPLPPQMTPWFHDAAGHHVLARQSQVQWYFCFLLNPQKASSAQGHSSVPAAGGLWGWRCLFGGCHSSEFWGPASSPRKTHHCPGMRTGGGEEFVPPVQQGAVGQLVVPSTVPGPVLCPHSVQEFMTFTSQLITERSALGSRASVKEQGETALDSPTPGKDPPKPKWGSSADGRSC